MFYEVKTPGHRAVVLQGKSCIVCVRRDLTSSCGARYKHSFDLWVFSYRGTECLDYQSVQ
jgi:hypothetical protein